MLPPRPAFACVSLVALPAMGCASTRQTGAGAAGGGAAGKPSTLLACQVGSPHKATNSRSRAKGAVAAPRVRFQAAGVCEEDDVAEPRRARRALISDQPAVVHMPTVESFFTNATEPEEEGQDPLMEARRSAARKPTPFTKRTVTVESEEDEAASEAHEDADASPPVERPSFTSPATSAGSRPRYQEADTSPPVESVLSRRSYLRTATPCSSRPEGTSAAADDDDDDEMPSLVAVPGAVEEAKTKAWFPCCDEWSGQGETQSFHPRDSDEVRFNCSERPIQL
mmetsp:Transcript_9619/g.24823  ORF Transcript_9619/g.24823 Transcript_9619/m.24823 type:complete len:282 (-) Transcript_9619:125-970(-)